jgi:hypothetical protein
VAAAASVNCAVFDNRPEVVSVVYQIIPAASHAFPPICGAATQNARLGMPEYWCTPPKSSSSSFGSSL